MVNLKFMLKNTFKFTYFFFLFSPYVFKILILIQKFILFIFLVLNVWEVRESCWVTEKKKVVNYLYSDYDVNEFHLKEKFH